MTYVFYLNLWGTTAKLPPEDVTACQRYFHRLVREQSVRYELEAYALVDYAYVYSSDLAALTSYATEVFGAMLFPENRAGLWPIRGAVAAGAERIGDLWPIPWMGVGSVHAAELEKSAQKGMRLLIDSRAMSSDVKQPTRNFAVRGSQHFEVNWMKSALAGGLNRKRLEDVCAELMSEGTNYSQQLSASLSGLLRWSDNLEQRDQVHGAHDGAENHRYK